MQPGAELQTLFLAAKVLTKQQPPNKTKKKEEIKQKKESDSHKTEPQNTKNKTAENHKKEGCEKPSKNIRVVL